MISLKWIIASSIVKSKQQINDKLHFVHVSPKSLVNYRILIINLVRFFYESICGDNKWFIDWDIQNITCWYQPRNKRWWG